MADTKINNLLNKYSKDIKIDEELNKINAGVYQIKSDKLKYRIMKLENELEVFMIEDAITTTSLAKMMVSVGHIDNPDDADGMAHFLEHMLFMGSEEYPGESYFENKVNENGGSSNASTSDKLTQYFFDVESKKFIFILKIFSYFFINPRFDIKYVEKEISAIESEHQKNIGSDTWRMYNLSKLFLMDDINRKFGTGTRKTLLGKSNNEPKILRQKLIDFYEKYYSSDKMILFISHNKIDDELINTIKESFGRIEKRTKIYTINKTTFNIDNNLEIIKMKSIQNINSLILKWLVDGTPKYVNNLCVDAFAEIMYIIGHEGDGSLYQLLFKEGYITSLHFDIDGIYYDKTILSMRIVLTNHGYDNYLGIIYIINNYIQNLVKLNSKIKSSKSLFDLFSDEIEKIDFINLQTNNDLSGSRAVMSYSSIHDSNKCDLKYIPISSIMLDEKKNRNKHFDIVLRELNINNLKCIVSSNSIVNTDKIDPYYGTQYSIEVHKIDPELKKKYDIYEHTIPILNPYLPKNIRVIDPISDIDESYIKMESAVGNIYYLKKSNMTKSYNAYAKILINLDELKDIDIDKFMIVYMYIAYIKEYFNSEFYLLNILKIITNIAIADNKLSIVINGCTDNIDNIVEKIMNKYYNRDQQTSFEHIEPKIYETVYQSTYDNLLDYDISEPYTRLQSEFNDMVNYEYNMTYDKMLKGISKISPDKLKNNSEINYSNMKDIAIEIMSTGSIKGMFGGSITVKQVQNIIKYLDNTIKYKYSILIPNLEFKNMDYIEKKIINKNPHSKDIGYGYGIYMCKVIESENDEWKSWKTIKPYCIMLASYISDKFSSLLRTQKEIGYVAYASLINVNVTELCDFFLLFQVQSQHNEALYMIKDYVNNLLLDDIKSITDETFENMKNGMISRLLQPASNIISEINDKFYAMIVKENYNENELFDRNKIIAIEISKMKKENIIEFIKPIINNNFRGLILIMPMN